MELYTRRDIDCAIISGDVTTLDNILTQMLSALDTLHETVEIVQERCGEYMERSAPFNCSKTWTDCEMAISKTIQWKKP